MKTGNPIIQIKDTIAILEWTGASSSDEYRVGHLHFGERLQEENCRHWLLNYRQGRKIEKEDQTWTSDQWFPHVIEMAKSDVKKIAVIVSKNIFNKVAVRIITTRIQQYDIDIAFFNQVGEGKAWLLGIDYPTYQEWEKQGQNAQEEH